MTTPSSPLIPKNLPPNPSTTPAPPSTYRALARAVGAARLLFGASCLLAPAFTMSLLRIPLAGTATTFVRVFGVRDLVLGDLLLLATSSSGDPDGRARRAEVMRLLWAGVAVDLLDVCVAQVALGAGDLGMPGYGLFCGLGVVSAVLAGEALWGY
ncbi:uncharacterized protein DNG_05714 [Cephalotrichum gorgonifer]|uniref:Uncharacterized protein n=1 Tax=Cephalotrichum gorgonifer TaxID=2041049 RepID=A0AAE8N0C7_9PEZI|nr:uncharacterized protein DNG_05714 [Cephalotrichum gorgonifer]